MELVSLISSFWFCSNRAPFIRRQFKLHKESQFSHCSAETPSNGYLVALSAAQPCTTSEDEENLWVTLLGPTQAHSCKINTQSKGPWASVA